MHRYFDILSLSHKMMPDLDQVFADRFDIQVEHFSTANNLRNCELEGIIVHDQTDDITPYHESKEIDQAWNKGAHVPTNGLGHSLKDERIIRSICHYISDGIVPLPIGVSS